MHTMRPPLIPAVPSRVPIRITFSTLINPSAKRVREEITESAQRKLGGRRFEGWMLEGLRKQRAWDRLHPLARERNRGGFSGQTRALLKNSFSRAEKYP